MIGVVFGLLGLALLLGATLAFVVRAYLTAKNDAGHAADLFRSQCALTDEAIRQRDSFKGELDVSRQQMAVMRVRIATAEHQRNEASGEAMRAVVDKIKHATPQAAADAVNEILSKPLGGPITELK